MQRLQIILVALILFLASPVWATDYYIDYGAGNDANAGTATGTAWKHFPKDPDATGVSGAHTIAGGNTYYFKQGDQYDLDTDMTITESGTSGNVITITSSDAWGDASGYGLIHGGSNPIEVFDLNGADYVTISKMELTAFPGVGGNTGMGIHLHGTSNNVTIDDVKSHGESSSNTYGFYSHGTVTSLELTDSTAYNNSYNFIVGGGVGNYVRRCTAYDAGIDGFRVNDDKLILYFEDSISYSNDQDGWDLFDSDNKIINNSKAYDNTAAGFKLGGNETASGTVVTNSIAYGNVRGFRTNNSMGQTLKNNTAYNNSIAGFDVYCQSPCAAATVTLTGNIAYENGTQDLRVSVGGGTLTFDYNNWYSAAGTVISYQGDTYTSAQFATYQSEKSQDANGISDNPDFTNAAGNDFTLTSVSPCIDLLPAPVTLLDPDSTWPSSVVTMQGTELGAFGYEDAPPGAGGDTGLYNVLGGSKQLTLGGSKTSTLSGE
jgi:hypothetical protein